MTAKKKSVAKSSAKKPAKEKGKPHPAVKKVKFEEDKTPSDPLEKPAALKDLPATGIKEIQIRMTDKSRKSGEKRERQFTKVAEASAYVEEVYNQYPDSKAVYSSDGRLVTVGRVELYANYDLRKVVRGTAPEGVLPMLSADFGRGTAGNAPLKVRDLDKSKDTPGALSVPKKKTDSEGKSASGKKIVGKVIVLKAICQELSLDPRKARAKLRGAAKKKELPREAEGGRWQWEEAEAEQVRAILKKKD